MSDDMQFGEVEESQPQQNLRPDRNRHFAVVAYGQPVERDLPIFVDLDVLLDMEAHAASDKTVELGGVMLGGHYEDAEGQPFVVISDSLRAEHYESTKGSFKFTHDTWEKISRQRDEFPAEMQMAGWYHTHPDWGVFLSGMDMFICDNFFNKPLDVAYVIDPCRLDRAFFMWTGKPKERIRRTGGFFVTASRFRQAELEQTVQALEGKQAMPSYTPGSAGSPNIYVQSPPPPPKPAWEGMAMMGMLALQFCLLSLIAWKLLATPDGGDSAVAKLSLEKELAARAEAEQLAHQSQRDLLVMDRVLQEVKGTDRGLVEHYREEMNKRKDLELALRNSQAVQEHKFAEFEASLKKLERSNLDQAAVIETWEAKNEKLHAENTKLADDLKLRDGQIAALEKQLQPAADEVSTSPFAWPPNGRTWWYLGGGIIVLAAFGFAGYWFRNQAHAPVDESLVESPPSAVDSPATETASPEKNSGKNVG
ncbi:Mov34/MPN/PAD-1 family protein [Anatilimnocola aggregata]|uniref:Mov34/MPN/PAD-1 family protein n=1 Tax=Anatilimnocola aggregata TaxID=2528021 RepID=A0A517Y5T9_9BACT|nr:Mov34/MPN/PAD-1 family protein [Anatilimnocola aggregata]QDU25492.1 Mov34/MPN/PAD-1 family protein [Anatilimnocola aggregata]